jgi:hypothetical protein
MTIRPFLFLLPAALLAACSAQQKLLPPLAEVEVPQIDYLQPQPTGEAPAAPSTLEGETEAAIRAYLGEPALKRREDPAEIWRYGDENCGVHLFFYETEGSMRVEHADTVIAKGRTMTPAQCLSDLHQKAATAAN